MTKRKPQIDGLFRKKYCTYQVRKNIVNGQQGYCSLLLYCQRLPSMQQETMSLYGTCGSCFYRFKAFLLPVTTVKGHHIFSLEVFCQNGSHKLTACFQMYCTYQVRKNILHGEPDYYMVLLLEVTMYSTRNQVTTE